MSVLAELTIFPTDKGESVSEYVAMMIKIINDSGLDFELGPMGTCVEGEWDEVLEVSRKCMDKMKENSNRIYMLMKVDYRKGKTGRIKSKIESVKQKL